jgi:hypothetical protein
MGDFGIQEGMMLRNAILDIKDRNKAQAFDTEYKAHLKGVQADPNYKPEGDYDPKAFSQARVTNIDAQMKDQDFQKGVFEHQKEQIDSQYAKSIAFHRQAQAAASARDLGSELKAYEMAYENVFDGMDMKMGDDNMSYSLTDKLTGKTTTQTFKDPEEMTKQLRGMADGLAVERTFAQQAIQSRMQRAQINADQNWEPLTNSKGEKAWTTDQYNNDTGQVDKVYEVQGERVTGEEARRRGFTTPEKEKTIAEAEYKRAAGVAAGITAKRKGKGTPKERVKGTQEKQAEGYMRAYDVNETEAMDMVRQDQAKGNIADLMAKAVADGMMNDRELKNYRDSLHESYAPTEPTTRKARGLPKEAKSGGGKVPTDRLPDTKGLKEGQTAGKGKYIVKDGKWQVK